MEDLTTVLKAPTVDRGVIEQKRAERLAKVDAASKQMTAAFADIAEVLTPEQRKIVAALIEDRAERGGRGGKGEGRGWMRHGSAMTWESLRLRRPQTEHHLLNGGSALAGGPLPVECNAMPQPLLIIDDDVRLTGMLRDYLSAAGFEADVAGDGQSGLAAIERKPPDAVILDVMLPDIDGFEVFTPTAALQQPAGPDADRQGRGSRPHHRPGDRRG